MTITKPIFDVTHTACNGFAVTIYATPKGEWLADIGSGLVTVGPLPWTKLVPAVEAVIEGGLK